jgi:hypothetical protein
MAVLGLVVLAASAVPAAAATTAPADDQVCGAVLDHLHEGQTSSKVLRQDCASSRQSLESELGTNAQTLLMVLYEDANYGGSAKYWYGAFGPCDSEGYGIRDLQQTIFNFNDRISSWQIGSSSCSGVYMYTNAVYSGQLAYWHWWSQVPYVGDAMNDRISSIHISYEP